MLHLEKTLKLSAALVQEPNLTHYFTEEDLDRIGGWAFGGYTRDKQSRVRWEHRMEAAMDLALQLQKDKSWPWPNCSNIAFPLITIAALQFHSRAYPMIIQGADVVRYKVWNNDPKGDEMARARRVGKFMSYQLLEEDEDWEEQHDRMLIQLPIIGCAFKKTFYNGRHNESELVSATDLVLDYWSKSVEGAVRKTHVIPLYRNEVYEKVQAGLFRDVLGDAWFQEPAQYPRDEQDSRRDQRTGEDEPPADETTPFKFLEQHCLIDLDGDGYAEPYVVTLEAASQKVVRIVSRVERYDVDVEKNAAGRILRIKGYEHFTKYSFIPSPDNGIYDMGFGVLLGPLNESVNSLINQLVDSGTLNNLGGGFLGRGVKIRGGVYNVAPFQWSRVDSTGDDLRKGIFPLPTKEPSPVLYQLLGLLINYTERISGATDMMLGQNPGQNTPAETSRTMVEQGMKVYSNIFKRIWRGMKQEFKKLYELNAVYLPVTKRFGEEGLIAQQSDFISGSSNITPVADPNITSESMRLSQAQAVKQAAMMTPGYNIPEVEMEYLRALRVESPERLYPGPDKVPPLPNPKVQVEQMKMQGQQAALQQKQQQFILTLQEEHRLNTAKMVQLEAQGHMFLANAQGAEAGHQIAAFNAAIGAAKSHNEHLRAMIELIQKGMRDEQSSTPPGQPGSMGGLEAPPGNEGGPGMGGQMAQ
jgi:chaperonin GroES